jgi:hypothetical protein
VGGVITLHILDVQAHAEHGGAHLEMEAGL